MHLDMAGRRRLGRLGLLDRRGRAVARAACAMGVPRELALGRDALQPRPREHRRATWTGSAEVMPDVVAKVRKLAGSARACRERVLVAMSGGVDSSVAAARLVEQGYDVVGATMKLFCYGDDVPDRPCCSLDSINDARDVAHAARHPALRAQPRGPLRPPRHPELRERVQPRAHADPLRALQLVHQVPRPAGPRRRARLPATSPPATTPWRATAGSTAGGTAAKDQSYFLWGIDRAVVARMLTPVGELDEGGDAGVRARAAAHHRRQAGIGRDLLRARRRLRRACSSGTFRRTRRRCRRGPLVTTAGEVIGEHEGYARYTIGQRKGLPGGFAEPRYVVAIRPERREVVIGSADDLAGHRVRWRSSTGWRTALVPAGDACDVQIRHRARGGPATVLGASPDDELALALADAGPGDHAGPVGRAVRRGRPRAGRRGHRRRRVT